MPATVTTKELFPITTSDASIQAEIKLRIKAGAIRSWSEKTADSIILYTEWNVLGEQ
jgi:hypothetical protein